MWATSFAIALLMFQVRHVSHKLAVHQETHAFQRSRPTAGNYLLNAGLCSGFDVRSQRCAACFAESNNSAGRRTGHGFRKTACVPCEKETAEPAPCPANVKCLFKFCVKVLGRHFRSHWSWGCDLEPPQHSYIASHSRLSRQHELNRAFHQPECDFARQSMIWFAMTSCTRNVCSCHSFLFSWRSQIKLTVSRRCTQNIPNDWFGVWTLIIEILSFRILR